MTNHADDPGLQALEARLAGLTPQLSAQERNDLLYQCAFTAGQRSTRGTLRRWQAAAALLVAVSLGLTIPLASNSPLGHHNQAKTEPEPPPSKPVEIVTNTPSELIPLQRPIEIAADAWQLDQRSSDPLAESLAEFERTSPEMRSFAVAAMTRVAMNP
jgi:hypothetical protein